jgi:hypothetical protein
MKLHSAIKVNGRTYAAGENLPGLAIYPFFLIHMLAFGGSGFFLAYGGAPIEFVFMHGGIAILVYVVFYFAIFGRDEVKWMFINAGLGIFGIMSQIDWLLSLSGQHVSDFAWYVHIVPVLYFILYTFMLRHALLDLFGAREDDERRSRVEWGYVIGSLGVYATLHLLGL